MNRCHGCGTEIPARSGPGRPRKWCSRACERGRAKAARNSAPRVYKKRGECLDCKAPVWSSGERCMACYRAIPTTRTTSRQTPCVDCGNPSYGERCRPCAQDAGTYGQRIRSDDDYRVTRRLREQAAPGLSATERSNLLATWKRKGKRCTYCPALGTTVDHVLPLVRGGTNHEGNLTPCCKPCNSSKGGKTVAEWRTGRRLPPMKNPPPWATIVAKPRAKRARTTVQLELTPCSGCGALGVRKRCGDPECFKTEMRNRYRQRVGIPLDAPLYARASVLS